MLTLQEQIEDAIELLHEAKRIVVLTGAGISTESGIPDFRSSDSPWRTHPPVSYRDFLTSTQARQNYWQSRRALSAQIAQARPNAAHYALAKLERQQRLLGLLTQNFDGLHLDAGHNPDRVVELHGTSRQASCTLCGTRSSIQDLQARIDAGEIDPRCSLCGGFLKAATILFGQRVPEQALEQARALTKTCDLFLVVGSSLKVAPASLLPRLALSREVPLIIVNLEATALDEYADVSIHAPAGTILPAIINRLPISTSYENV